MAENSNNNAFKNGNNWFRLVLVLVGFFVGGGMSAFIGNTQYVKLEEKVNRNQAKFEHFREQENIQNLEMRERLARIEEKVDYIREQVSR